MRVHEFVDEGLGHLSYVVDLGAGFALVVDPPRFTDHIEQLAANEQLLIRWTLDTHSHADYVTGSPGLAARHGCPPSRSAGVGGRHGTPRARR